MLQKITITEPMAKRLLAGETVETDRLCHPSGDETFSGKLRLSDQGSDYGADLEIILPEKPPIGACPCCGGDVVETPISFRCRGHKEGCKFALWKKQKGSLFQNIVITSDLAKALLSGEVCTSDQLYSVKKEKTFSGSFRLGAADGQYGPRLELVPFSRSGAETASTMPPDAPEPSVPVPAAHSQAEVLPSPDDVPVPDFDDAPVPDFFESLDWEDAPPPIAPQNPEELSFPDAFLSAETP